MILSLKILPQSCVYSPSSGLCLLVVTIETHSLKVPEAGSLPSQSQQNLAGLFFAPGIFFLIFDIP